MLLERNISLRQGSHCDHSLHGLILQSMGNRESSLSMNASLGVGPGIRALISKMKMAITKAMVLPADMLLLQGSPGVLGSISLQPEGREPFTAGICSGFCLYVSGVGCLGESPASGESFIVILDCYFPLLTRYHCAIEQKKKNAEVVKN